MSIFNNYYLIEVQLYTVFNSDDDENANIAPNQRNVRGRGDQGVRGRAGAGRGRGRGRGVAIAPPRDLRCPNGRVWRDIPSKDHEGPEHIYDAKSRLRFRPYNEKTELDWFDWGFPPKNWSMMVRGTNEILSSKAEELTTKGELAKYLGIRLAMSVTPRRGGMHAHFETVQREGSVRTPGNFGERFEISRARFEILSAGFRLNISEDPRVVEKVTCTYYKSF
jgi:hypothetical protein